MAVTLAAHVNASTSLTMSATGIGGFYPDSPIAYPDLPYPDEGGTTRSELTSSTPTPVTLTAA